MKEWLSGRYRPMTLAALLAASAVGAGLITADSLVEQAHLAARYTARVAFPLFLLTYAASSLATLWPQGWSRALMRHRRYWGLSFAFAHTVHLVALYEYHVLLGDPPKAITLAGGGLAYGLLYVMALTSNSFSVRMLGSWWKRLHTIGTHWLWFVFAFTYFGRLGDPERWVQGTIFLPLALVALGLRIAASIKKRRTFPAGAGA